MTDIEEIGRAVELGRSGDKAGAREQLTRLWEQAGDPLHRCSIAHYLADLQESLADELLWDQRALATAPEQDRGFLPSLQLNLADVYRRLGDPARARVHLGLVDAGNLPNDDYGALIRSCVEQVTCLLDAGSQEPLKAT